MTAAKKYPEQFPGWYGGNSAGEKHSMRAWWSANDAHKQQHEHSPVKNECGKYVRLPKRLLQRKARRFTGLS